MCEEPRVPGNYEPGDDVEGYAEFQPDAIFWEDTNECRLCEDPHVPGNHEPGDNVERYAEFQPDAILWEDTNECHECGVCNRHG